MKILIAVSVWCILIPSAVVALTYQQAEISFIVMAVSGLYALVSILRPLRGSGPLSVFFFQRRYVALLSVFTLFIAAAWAGNILAEQNENRLAELRASDPAAYLDELEATDEVRWLSELEQLNPQRFETVMADRRARIAALDAEVRALPSSDTEGNLNLYRQLLALDPENGRYQERVALYEGTLERERWEDDNCKPNRIDVAFVMSQEFVERNLRAPRTARFPRSPSSGSAYAGECRYVVNSWVDAENAFGALIRTNYRAVLTYHKDGWQLEDLTM